MKSEFVELVGCEYTEITEHDYRIIEKVYMYYPNIESKKHIAELYKNFGMILMKDLYPRSLVIEEQENRIFKIKSDLLEELEKLENLKK